MVEKMLIKKKFRFMVLFIILCLPVGSFLCSGKTDYSRIINRKIFADTPPPQKSVVSILKPAPLPSLDSLIGLKGIIFYPEGKSLAIVQIFSKSNVELLLSEGDVVENAYLKKINEYSVVFLYDEKEVVISLPKPQPGKDAIAIKDIPVKVLSQGQSVSSTGTLQTTTISGSQPVVPVPEQPKTININEISEKLRSDPSLLAQVSVTPYIQDGKVEGFVVNRVPETGISSQLGIQPGDVIKRVNGTLIDSLSRAYAVYNNILTSQTKLVTVEILRNGQPLILTYRLE